jgi:site-specific DNA recombinase
MDRPGLQDAIRRCEQGEAQGIIVAKLDRFSRSLAGALAAIEQLQASGAQLISVADNIDSSTPTGRLMRDLLLGLVANSS